MLGDWVKAAPPWSCQASQLLQWCSELLLKSSPATTITMLHSDSSIADAKERSAPQTNAVYLMLPVGFPSHGAMAEMKLHCPERELHCYEIRGCHSIVFARLSKGSSQWAGAKRQGST